MGSSIHKGCWSLFFSVVIPGFMLQRLFFAEQSLGPDAYIDSMMQLFLDNDQTCTAISVPSADSRNHRLAVLRVAVGQYFQAY